MGPEVNSRVKTMVAMRGLEQLTIALNPKGLDQLNYSGVESEFELVDEESDQRAI